MNITLESTARLILTVLSHRKYKVILAVVAIIFALSYMVFTGIFIFTEKAIPEEYKVPMFYLGRIHTAYGDFPWFIAYLDRHTIFSMTMEALTFAVSISFLIGLNSALLAYRLSSPQGQACKSASNSIGFFGIIPAFLSIFACCGGGILVILFGAGVLSALFPYGSIFSVTSIAILMLGVLFNTKNIAKKVD